MKIIKTLILTIIMTIMCATLLTGCNMPITHKWIDLPNQPEQADIQTLYDSKEMAKDEYIRYNKHALRGWFYILEMNKDQENNISKKLYRATISDNINDTLDGTLLGKRVNIYFSAEDYEIVEKYWKKHPNEPIWINAIIEDINGNSTSYYKVRAAVDKYIFMDRDKEGKLKDNDWNASAPKQHKEEKVIDEEQELNNDETINEKDKKSDKNNDKENKKEKDKKDNTNKNDEKKKNNDKEKQDDESSKE